MNKSLHHKRRKVSAARSGKQGLFAVGASLPKIAGPALRKRGFVQAKLITEWPAIVGDMLAQETVPQKLIFERGNRGDGILYLRVNSGFAIELQHIAPQLIERINGFFGYRAVANLRLQQGPVLAPRRPRKINLKQLAEADEAQLQLKLRRIEDASLRDALAFLGRAVFIDRDHG